MDFLQSEIVKSALAGLLAAAVVDFAAFQSWNSYQDALAYDWKIALWRWFQGVVVGALAAFGLGVV